MRRNIAQALAVHSRPTRASQERKPFPNFGVYIDSDWSGYSNYNALQHQARTSRPRSLLDLRLHVGEEHRHQVGGRRHRRPRLQRLAGVPRTTTTRSAIMACRTSTWTIGWSGSFVYNLPFGNGEKFASDATGVKNAVVGGWQVNGIYTWQHGFPITVTAADLGGVNDTFGTNRADLVGDPNAGGSTRASNKWFNTAAFAQPALGQFGNLGRNTLRGPGINNLDFALFKNFELPKEHAAAVPARVVQRVQPPAVQRARHERGLAAVRRGRIGQGRDASTSWG